MAFMLGKHLMFLDSFPFMSSSLDKLVSNLPKDDLKYTSKEFTGKKLSLMPQKGVYPYDFMDSFEKFDLTELPTKEQFSPCIMCVQYIGGFSVHRGVFSTSGGIP